MGKVIIFIIILSSSALTSGAFANGTCTYETEQVVKNGQVIKTTEVKKCFETQQIGKEKVTFKIKEQLSNEQFQTALILTFVFILENL